MMRKTLSYGLSLALVAGFAMSSLAAAKKPASAPKKKAPVAAATTAPAASTPELIEPLEQSEANWTLGLVHTTGTGFALERGSLSQRRTMARREAYVDAYQGMSDAIEQIRVTGDSTIRDLLVDDESLKSKLDNLIKDCEISDGKQLPDGSVEVALKLPLFGEKGLSSLLLDKPVPEMATGSVGLVIDARGSGAQPAIAPQIKNLEGKILYDIPGLRYYHTVEAAKAVFSSPTMIKAKRSAGATRANIVLDDNTAKQVKPGLGRGSIIIVL